MAQNEPTNVLTAFEMLLEEVENEIEFVNTTGAKAFAERDYGHVRRRVPRPSSCPSSRDKTATLRRERQNRDSP